jgi:hypothetical protein
MFAVSVIQVPSAAGLALLLMVTGVWLAATAAHNEKVIVIKDRADRRHFIRPPQPLIDVNSFSAI